MTSRGLNSKTVGTLLFTEVTNSFAVSKMTHLLSSQN